MKNSLQLSKNARYEWRPDFGSKIVKTDIKVVISELKKINDQYGEITPALLVEASKQKKSVFHNYFEWDDNTAAESWRFMQARYLLGSIQVNVVKEGKPVRMQAYQITKKSMPKAGNTTYTKFDSITQDNKAYILQQALNNLITVRNKLQNNDFDQPIPHIEKAIKLLQKESEVIHVTSS